MKTLFLISYLDKYKRCIDSQLVKAKDLNAAKRIAIEEYAKIGDRAIYAGFVVQEEKNGGY
jgi:hypothetical protein